MLGEITLVKEYDDWLDYIHEFLNASQISWKTIMIVSRHTKLWNANNRLNNSVKKGND